MAAAGLAALVVSIFAFDKTTPFPSGYTVLPVLGTCFVLLFADLSNWTGRLLSLRPMVGIGLISYSAYLWHQPLFAFMRLYNVDHHPSVSTMLGLSLLSLVFAYFSWRFVETPFRKRGPRTVLPNRTLALSLSVAAIAIGVVAGAAGHLRDGWPSRFTMEQQGFIADNKWSTRCLFTRLDPIGDLPAKACTFDGQEPVKGKVALIGDSVMSSMSPELIAFFTENGYAVEQFTHSYCTLHRKHRTDKLDAQGCPVFISNAVDYIADNNFDLVVSASSFITFFNGFPEGLVREGRSEPATFDSLRADMQQTISDLNSPLLLIYPHPVAPIDVLNASVRQLRTQGVVNSYAVDVADFVRQRDLAYQMLDEAVLEDTLRLDLTSSFCSQSQCHFISDGIPVLSDVVHFTPYGARVIVRPGIKAVLEESEIMKALKG